jgi:hypothetical protein
MHATDKRCVLNGYNIVAIRVIIIKCKNCTIGFSLISNAMLRGENIWFRIFGCVVNENACTHDRAIIPEG